MENHIVEWWHIIIGMGLRYWIVAGLAYLIFYTWRRKSFIKFKIQKAFPKTKAVRTEILYSSITIIIFGVVVYLTLFTSFRDYTKIYRDFDTYSNWYLVPSFLLIILLHDSYFYWIHRLMHWKKIFSWVHQIHHKSHNPTPLAAFAFHPIEAVLEIAFLPLVLILFPFHSIVVFLFGMYMILMNVLGHLGYELFPSWFLKYRGLKLFNTSTHHNMHHRYGKGNYGLYFNIWDKLLKTNHAKYEEEFNIASQGKERENE